VNILRVILAVLAILILLATLPSFDPQTVQLAVLPLVCLFFGFFVALRFALPEDDLTTRAAASRLLATRAPPLS